MSNATTVQRALTESDKRKMRAKHLVIIPALIVASAVLWVVLSLDQLPQPARWAGGGIAVLTVIVFAFRQIKMEKDLRSGIVHVLSGKITKKRKFGGNRKGASTGISSRKRSGGISSTTYFLYIDGKQFNVPAKMYSKVEKGNWVEMHYFPKSRFYLDILVVEKDIN